jgi:hypothetical protein
VRRFVIVSHEGDLHALMVSDCLRRAGDHCAVIASDSLLNSGSLSWRFDQGARGGRSVCQDIDGHEVAIAEVDLVWWRRMPRGVSLDVRGNMPDVVEVFASNNIRASFLGAFLTDFRGVWIDRPDCIQHADNKLVQLRAAASAGFRVPRTLVSQNPQDIRAFQASLSGPMIVKAVAGMLGVPSVTGRVTPELLQQDGPLMACPAIYQELIPGNRHLRVLCFGKDVETALIESEELDWRYPLAADIRSFSLNEQIVRSLRQILSLFGLSMGIFDLKLTNGGDIVWLELNPQGQFLFVQALSDIELAEPFARFLIHAANGMRTLQ